LHSLTLTFNIRHEKNRKRKKRKQSYTTKRTSGKHMKAEPEKEEWGSFNKNRGLKKFYIQTEIKKLKFNL
jgi:hypothetical protein